MAKATKHHCNRVDWPIRRFFVLLYPCIDLNVVINKICFELILVRIRTTITKQNKNSEIDGNHKAEHKPIIL